MYLEKFRLDGKTAFITGGGRGIGLAAAEAFAEAGARVVISGPDETLLADGIESLRAAGHEAESIIMDVRDSARVRDVAEAMNADGRQVDILFANAGIAWPDIGGEEMDDATWDEVIDINLNGVFRCCRSFGKHMIARGSGSVITTGSMSGIISNVPQRQVHYNASKAGVHHLTRSLAGEWGLKGVRVNAIAPGYINTAISGPALKNRALTDIWFPRTPMGRGGEASEIATVALFLASDAASFMTGSVVVVDGGYCVW